MMGLRPPMAMGAPSNMFNATLANIPDPASFQRFAQSEAITGYSNADLQDALVTAGLAEPTNPYQSMLGASGHIAGVPLEALFPGNGPMAQSIGATVQGSLARRFGAFQGPAFSGNFDPFQNNPMNPFQELNPFQAAAPRMMPPAFNQQSPMDMYAGGLGPSFGAPRASYGGSPFNPFGQMATSAAPAMNGPWVQEGPNGVSWGYNYQSRNAMGSFNGVPFEMNDASPYAAPMMPYMPTPSPEAFFSGQFGPMMANAMQGAAQGWGMGANPGFNPFSAF